MKKMILTLMIVFMMAIGLNAEEIPITHLKYDCDGFFNKDSYLIKSSILEIQRNIERIFQEVWGDDYYSIKIEKGYDFGDERYIESTYILDAYYFSSDERPAVLCFFNFYSEELDKNISFKIEILTNILK